MVTSTGYKDQFYAKAAEIEVAAAGLADAKAAQSPGADEWSARDLLSHLLGDAQGNYKEMCERFVSEDKPELPLVPGQTYSDKSREDAPIQTLLGNVVSEYKAIGDWAATLTDEQLARPAYIAFLKETPLTDSPSLQTWLGVIVNYHLPDHINQLKTLCQ